MALHINGTHIASGSTVMVNGQAVNRLVCNGVEVWKKAQVVVFERGAKSSNVIFRYSKYRQRINIAEVTTSGSNTVFSFLREYHPEGGRIDSGSYIFRFKSDDKLNLIPEVISNNGYVSGLRWGGSQPKRYLGRDGDPYGSERRLYSAIFLNGLLNTPKTKYVHVISHDDFGLDTVFSDIQNPTSPQEILYLADMAEWAEWDDSYADITVLLTQPTRSYTSFNFLNGDYYLSDGFTLPNEDISDFPLYRLSNYARVVSSVKYPDLSNIGYAISLAGAPISYLKNA